MLGESAGKFLVKNVGQDMADVTLNGVSGREFGGLVLAVGFEFRKAGMMASQVGVGSWLGGPMIFSPQLASKGCCISDQVKMIEG